MADPNNKGQFGNREDTEEIAQMGGEASGGSQNLSKAARSKGGKRSHGGGRKANNR